MSAEREAMRLGVGKNDVCFAAASSGRIAQNSARLVALIFNDADDGDMNADVPYDFFRGVYLSFRSVDDNDSRRYPLQVSESA